MDLLLARGAVADSLFRSAGSLKKLLLPPLVEHFIRIAYG